MTSQQVLDPFSNDGSVLAAIQADAVEELAAQFGEVGIETLGDPFENVTMSRAVEKWLTERDVLAYARKRIGLSIELTSYLDQVVVRLRKQNPRVLPET